MDTGREGLRVTIASIHSRGKYESGDCKLLVIVMVVNREYPSLFRYKNTTTRTVICKGAVDYT